MKKHLRINFPTPMTLAVRILQWELPMIMIWALAMFISLLRDYSANPLGASHTFIDRVEYIGAALVLSCMTAVLTDLILREQKEQKNR